MSSFYCLCNCISPSEDVILFWSFLLPALNNLGLFIQMIVRNQNKSLKLYLGWGDEPWTSDFHSVIYIAERFTSDSNYCFFLSTLNLKWSFFAQLSKQRVSPSDFCTNLNHIVSSNFVTSCFSHFSGNTVFSFRPLRVVRNSWDNSLAYYELLINVDFWTIKRPSE